MWQDFHKIRKRTFFLTNEDCFMYKIVCLNNFTLSGIFEVFDSISCNNIFINYGGYENEEIASKFFAGGGGHGNH